MKRFAIMAGALMLVATFVTSESFADKPLRANPAVHVQNSIEAPVESVGWRRDYRRGYYGNYSYYGPRYGYYGPSYRSSYYPGYQSTYYRDSYGPTYYGSGYYYGPSYYRGPAGAVNVYPGGVSVGGLNLGW